MCDTVVALGNSTADGSVLFAKNSDREPNEAQQMVLVPAADHDAGSPLKCTYIEIPQAAHTHAVLLSQPFWMWGAEMGANEFGVTIGNEAVFTKVPYDKGPALTGMDLLRLGLERSQTAVEALEVITQLLEEHGQGGNCGFKHPFYYHNSFLIADPSDAWVLETAGRQWAAQQVKDIRSISNGLTIGRDWDRASAGLVDFAMEKGWCKTPAEFSFRKCYSDVLYTRFSDSQKRQVCTTDLLQQARGRITPRVMMDVLQSHSGENASGWSPDQGIVGADVCMHVGFGPIRQSQTVASLVSHLKAGETVHWFTGTASPCLSLFKPAWFDAGLPAMGPGPTGIFDPESLFWRHERLHRTVLGNYQARKGAFAAEQRAVQDRWIHAAARMALPERLAYSQCCLEEEARLESTWLEEVRRHASNQDAFYTRFAWNGFNREAMFLP